MQWQYGARVLALNRHCSSERSNHLAETKPTSATLSKPARGFEEKYNAHHAIDTDLSTLAISEPLYGESWLKLEFDETHFIHKIVIYYQFYTDWFVSSEYWCTKKENNFRRCVDHDNNVDVSVYQGEVKQKSCGTLQLTYGLEQSDQIYTLICNIDGDSVKLSKTSTKDIAVADVVVISTGKPEVKCGVNINK